jgi:hypothetical protein
MTTATFPKTISCTHPRGRAMPFRGNALTCGHYIPLDGAYNHDQASLFSCVWCVFAGRPAFLELPPPTTRGCSVETPY